MVKEALAQLRRASTSTNSGEDLPHGRSPLDKLAQIFTFRRDSKRAAD
jgi:hypothetical protein